MNISNNQNEIISFTGLPPEDITHITSFLPIKAVKQLRATCFEMQLITQVFINADTQETLERYISYKPALSSKIELAKVLPNNSEERIQFLRDAICSLFFVHMGDKRDQIEWNHRSHNGDNWSLHGHLEYTLATQILKIIKSTSNIECYYSYDDSIKWFIALMDVLENNEINPETVEIKLVKKKKPQISLDEKILNLILKTIQNNKSISKLILSANMWHPNDLEKILKVIKLNEKIKQLEISEGNGFFDFGVFHQRELTTIISNQLVTSVMLNHNLTKWNWNRDQ